ncbi:MAG: hypothetical protein ACRDIY_01300 [Chloroflexota bacterium]
MTAAELEPSADQAPEVTMSVRILGFRADVRGPASVVRAFARLTPAAPAWTTTGEADVSSHFQIYAEPFPPGGCRLVRDGIPWTESAPADDLLAHLDVAVNSTAVEKLGPRYLFFHAGAVAFGNVGLILPAPPGSGKTTLVAGLIAGGFRYLSDEVAVLDPASSSRLLPFPKSLFVKPGARDVLAARYPALVSQVPSSRFGDERVWYLPPPPNAWPLGPVAVRAVIFPRYGPGQPTTLVEIPRSLALSGLLKQSFNLGTHHAPGIAAVVAMLRGAACFTLTVGDLDQAVAVLTHYASAAG